MKNVIKYNEFGLTAFVVADTTEGRKIGYDVSLRDEDFDLLDCIRLYDLAEAIRAAKSGIRSGNFVEFV